MATSGELIVSIIGDMEGLKKVFRDVQTEISGMGSKMSSMGKEMSSAGSSMTTGITAPILAVAAGIGVSVSAASDFDTQIRRVGTMLPGITEEGFNKIKKQSLDLSKQFGSDTADINNAMYQALSSGIPQDNIFEFMQTSEKLAIGGATDVATAVDGLTSVVNSYGASQIDAARASDIMFQGTKLGKSTIEELSKQMADVVPLAAANKISFEDVNASLATMTIQGTRTPVAMTQLKTIINELSQDTTQAGQAFKNISGQSFKDFIAGGGTVGEAIQLMNKNMGEYIPTVKDMAKFTKEFDDPASQMSQQFNELTGKSFQQFIKDGGSVQQAMKIMGVEGDKTTKTVTDLFSSIEAKTGVLQLSGEGAKIYAADMVEMGKATGSTDAAYKTMAEGIGTSTNIMKADFKSFVIEAGNSFMPVFKNTIVPFVKETLIPALNKMIPVIVSIMTAFGNLSPTLQILIIGFIGLIAAIGPILMILGAVASGIGAIAGLFAAGGLLASGGAIITALGAAIGLLASPITILIGVVALLALAWARDWGGIREKAAAVWEFIQTTAAELYNRLEYTYHAMIMSVSTLRTNLGTIWNVISSVFSTVTELIVSIITIWYTRSLANFNLIVAAGNTLLSAWRTIWTSIQTALSTVQAALLSILETLYSTAQGIFTRIVAAVQNLLNDWRNRWTMIETIIRNTKDIIRTTLSNIYSDAVSIMRTIISAITEPVSGLETTIRGYFAGMYNAGKGLLDNFLSGIRSKIQDIKDEVNEIVEWVADNLPMNSPAKMGPLSKIPKWDDIFYLPMRSSMGKMKGSVAEGLAAISQVTNTGAVSNVYEGSQINIGPNNLSNQMDIQTLVDEINRRVTAQRRARGYIL